MRCKNCQKDFTITDTDRAFYNKINVPPPTHCPDCRQQRRLSWRNLINLYLRKCDFSGRQIVSTYSPDKPFKVYDQKDWWGDGWEPLDYGRDFDFTRSFFDQFKELQLQVPRPALLNKDSVNSEYTNHSGFNKNCYMCFNVGTSEDMMYCTNYILDSRDCCDCYDLRKSELLYECFAARSCYNSKFLWHCLDCSDSAFLYGCHGCHDCFMSWNLRNAEYCILNKKYTKEDYQTELQKIYPRSYEEWQKKKQEFLLAVGQEAIHKYARIEKSNNSSGSDIGNCLNVENSYYAFDSVNCAYCYDIAEIKDSYDTYEPWRGELQYECHAMNQSYNVKGCSICYQNSNLAYCEFCHNSKDLFGCISLRKKQYCILNKQYTEEEYKKLLPQIIDQMKKTGEWGEFLPTEMSPFAYNETVAQEYYPLTEAEAKSKGLKWRAEEPGEADASLLKCLDCGKNFKIVPQEKKFYEKMSLPEPERCFKCRYHERLKLRDARQIFVRQCLKCVKDIKSIYPPRLASSSGEAGAPDRPEKVYCEFCYQQEIY